MIFSPFAFFNYSHVSPGEKRNISFIVKLCSVIILVLATTNERCRGQEPGSGTGYQMVLINNPAFAGSNGDGSLRMSYVNYLPGNGYNLHSVWVSYDSYFPVLHGGAGFAVTDDYTGGIINDLRAAMSYSYSIQLGRDLFINAGLSASVIHRGFNFGGAVLPDQIDPLGGASLPSAEALAYNGETLFDLGAGLVLMSERFFGGISVTHLNEPGFTETGPSDEKLKRTLFSYVAGDFGLGSKNDLRIRPQIFSAVREGYLYAAAGASVEVPLFSISVLAIRDGAKNLNLQPGFSFTKGNLSIYYNYTFSVASGNNLMPFSLLHQTGLAYSLNNVEKRNSIKTINFPK
jgi:type IX secretion system PorP/SprF family membrane protein